MWRGYQGGTKNEPPTRNIREQNPKHITTQHITYRETITSRLYGPPLSLRVSLETGTTEREGGRGREARLVETVVSRISVLWFSELVASGIGSRAWASAMGTVGSEFPDDAPPFFAC